MVGELLTCFDCQSIVNRGEGIKERNDSEVRIVGKIRRQKERALTSPKTSALAFISVLPWRINDGEILNSGSKV